MRRHRRIGWQVLLAAAAWAGFAADALALNSPGPCGTDQHVQCAVYDRNEVYQVATSRGKAVLLQFEEGEVVADNGVGIGGEPKAWAGATGTNWFFLQPNRANADTNLTIVTNRRTYVLSLVTATKSQPATWVLRFSYPDTQAKAAATEARKAERAQKMVKAGADATEHRNEAYAMRGNVELAPTAMWDDGRFTYFKYANGRDLPRVFQILADGSEAQPNRHMDGDTIVVHTVAKAFNIRLGNAVLGIRNDGYEMDAGQYNASGTSVPGLVRLTKEPSEGGTQ